MYSLSKAAQYCRTGGLYDCGSDAVLRASSSIAASSAWILAWCHRSRLRSLARLLGLAEKRCRVIVNRNSSRALAASSREIASLGDSWPLLRSAYTARINSDVSLVGGTEVSTLEVRPPGITFRHETERALEAEVLT